MSVAGNAISVVVGAALASNYKSVFASAEKSAFRLGKAYRETDKKLAAARNVEKYRNLLQELQAKQDAAGGGSKRLAAGIAEATRRYKAAKAEAKGYGLEIGQIAKEQRKLKVVGALQRASAAGVGGIGKLAGGSAAAVTAGVGIGTAAFGMLSGASDRAEQLTQQANAIGMSTAALQKYWIVAEDAGYSTEAFNGSIQKMTTGIAAAAKGQGKARQALKDLGLSAAFLQHLSPERQMEAIAKAMEGVSNEGERAQIAAKLFGDGAVPLMSKLTKSRQELKDQLHAAGDTGDMFSDEALKLLAEFDSAAEGATHSVGGLKNMLILGLLPSAIALTEQVQPLVGRLLSFGQTVREGIQYVGGMKNVVAVLAGVALPMLANVALPAVAAGIMAVGTAITANPMGLILKGLVVGVMLLAANWDTVKSSIVGGLETLKTVAVDVFNNSPLGLLLRGAQAAGGAIADWMGETSNAGAGRGSHAAAVAAAAAVPSAAQVAARGGSGGTNVESMHVYAAPGMDEKKLAEQVAVELDKRDRAAASRNRGRLYD